VDCIQNAPLSYSWNSSPPNTGVMISFFGWLIDHARVWPEGSTLRLKNWTDAYNMAATSPLIRVARPPPCPEICGIMRRRRLFSQRVGAKIIEISMAYSSLEPIQYTKILPCGKCSNVRIEQPRLNHALSAPALSAVNTLESLLQTLHYNSLGALQTSSRQDGAARHRKIR